MQLTAAKLLSADVLMLAGPSGHSDMNDMSGWRTCWRTSLLASSVPHTSTPFLDKMCTHSGDFQNRKLETFRGTKDSCLTQLVEKHPERHVSISESMALNASEPGSFERVKSRSSDPSHKQCGFTYPTTQSLQSWT